MKIYRDCVKRVLGFVLSLVAIICLSPLFLVVTVWLHYANKGAGAFFFQERPGKNGKIFKIVKYKTMTDERDADGNKFRFPQIGGLIIGDDVEVGANTCIDRGALSDTIIGDHTKINNLCHIAHNNKIGKNVTITGCVNVSGSNVIEDDVWIAPNASIRGYIHLGKACTVGMGAVATKDIPSGETWVGNPARCFRK